MLKVLNIKQMLKLYELGLDINETQFCWKGTAENFDKAKGSNIYTKHELIDNSKSSQMSLADLKYIPTLTFQEIYEFLPKCIKERDYEYFLHLVSAEDNIDDTYVLRYSFEDFNDYFNDSGYDTVILKEFENTDMLKTAYNMLVWYLKNKHKYTVLS